MSVREVIIIIVSVLFLVSYLIYKFAKKKGEQSSVQSVTQAAANNEPLDAPCTIQIRVKNNVANQVGGPWKYGFSLNGQAPVFTELGGQMELTTYVKHNALLGYGRGTYGGYKKPNIEEPFRFDAESGSIIKLVADAQFTYKNDAIWKSNLSYEEA